MTDSNSDPQPPELIDVRQLANAIRFFFFTIVLGLSGVSLKAAQSIDTFAKIFKDMLNGKPLPMLTSLVLSGQPFFVAISLLITTVAIASLFSRRVVASLYLLAVLGLVAVSLTSLLYGALTWPLVEIIRQMGQGAG